MSPTGVTRRDFSFRAVSTLSALGAAGLLGVSAGEQGAVSPGTDEVLRNSESIRQTVTFKAARRRVYDALTDAAKFDRVVHLSAAMKAGMPPGAKPTEISREPGGLFSLFGGHISGRHVELVPGERIVQAWRVADWSPGTYSIAKFELADEGSGTRLVFTHTGFPEGQGQHLAEGWHGNYWEPLGKYLAG